MTTSHDITQRDASEALDALFAPKKLAIFDASQDVAAYAHPVWRLLRQHGYDGDIAVVGTSGAAEDPTRPFPVYEQLPPDFAPDVAIAALPHEEVEGAINASHGASVFILVTPGYAEASGPGAARQQTLVSLAHEHGMRLLGPNCLGAINATNGALLCRTSVASQAPLLQGPISLFCQSGSMLSSLLATGQQQGIGFRHLAATGNEADLTLDDFLAYSLQDPETRAIGLVIEGLRRPQRFLQLAQKALSQGRPIVALHVGRSAASQHMIQRHTAAIATHEAVMQSAFHKVGIIGVKTPEALLSTAQVMATTPPPRSPSLAIWGTSGGICGMLADLAVDAELPMASLAENEAIQALAHGDVPHPIDLGSLSHPDGYKPPDLIPQVIKGLEQQPDIGIALAGLAPGYGLAKKIDQLIASQSRLATVLYAPLGDDDKARHHKAQLRQAGWHPIESTHAAIAAAKGLATYATARQRQPSQTAPTSALSLPRPSFSLDDSFVDALGWLASLGVATPPGALVTSAEAAESEAHRLGTPLVMKLVAQGLYHKADQGGICTIKKPTEAPAHFRRLMAFSGAEGVYLQRQVEGWELLFGSQLDPQLGLLLVLASGGRRAEHQAGAQILLPPLGEDEIRRALMQVREGLGGPHPALLRSAPRTVRRTAHRMGEGERDFQSLISAERSNGASPPSPVGRERGCQPKAGGGEGHPPASPINLITQLAAVAQVLADEGRTIECNPIVISPEGPWIVDAWITPSLTPSR